jgi:hypothetical protein
LINKIKIRRITRRLFKKAIIKNINNSNYNNNNNNNKKNNLIPAYLSGLKIKVGGRLMKYRIKRKKTVRMINKGASSVGKINFNDFARYTNKNKRGAFSISISSGQNFI